VKRVSSRLFPFAACMLLAVAATAMLAACGSSDSAESLTFERTTEGKESLLTVPESAEAGEAEITFVNNGDGPADLQLIRAEGDRTPEEVVDGLAEATSGKPFPEWFFAAGGAGVTPADGETTVTQVLEPGTYYAFDTEGSEGPPDASTITGMEVTGEESDDSLAGDATISAFEYGFESEGIAAGENEFVFENKGVQPHHVIALKMVGDSTIEDVNEFFKSDGGGKPPVEEGPPVGTAVVEGGESQLTSFELEPGRYALVCFISDRQGGPPHVVKGMIEELEVE